MALYIAAVKSLGEKAFNFFINNPRIKGILYDMSFDYNGIGLQSIQSSPISKSDKSK